MPWYVWIWGAVTTAGMGIWALLGVVALEDQLDKRKTRKQQPRVVDLELKVMDLERALKETRKGANEFGRISP